jgi:DNA-binding IclR family transcriptional regulator
VFLLENCTALKSFAAIPEEFSCAHPDEELPNKTTVHRLVTTFQETRKVSVALKNGRYTL